MKDKLVMKFLETIIVVVLVVVIFGCNTYANNQEENWPQWVKIGSASPGGYWFSVAATLAEIINANFPGVNAAPTAGGQITNLKNCNSGEFQIGLGCSYTEHDASVGKEPFEEPLTNVSSIGNLYPSQFHIITLEEAGINSIADLKGHPFSPGKPGWGGEVTAKRVLAEYGMTYEDLGKMTLTGYSDAALLMKDKHIHAMFIQILAPSPAFIDVGSYAPLNIISIGEDKLKDFCEKYYMFEGVVKGGTYPGEEDDVICACATNEFIVNNDLPEDMVYEITKALWENNEKFKDIAVGMEPFFEIEDALKGLGLPLHKGAYKYYIERGFDVPESLTPID